MRDERQPGRARQPAVRRISARLDPDRHQRPRRRARLARARHRAVAGHDGRGQLRRAHPQHHRRAVADQRRPAEQGRGAAQRHDGLEPRRLRPASSGKNRRAPGCSADDARLGASGRRNASRKVSASSDRPCHACATWRDGRHSHDFICSTCAIPPNTKPGHVAGAISAPGGQLVQATDQYVGTLGARIVLVDDAEVRAMMTASWLRQMGWTDVFVLAEAGAETGWPASPLLNRESRPEAAIHPNVARRTSFPERGNDHRSIAQPRLSQGSHPRCVVRHSHAARGRAQKFRSARWC